MSGSLVSGSLKKRARWLHWAIMLVTVASLSAVFGVSILYAAPKSVFWPAIRLQRIAGGFASPVNMVSPNDGTERLFVLEKGGMIYIIENGVRLEDEFLDISDRVSSCPECGLLGVAFPPDFAQRHYFFVYYTSEEELVPPDTGDADPTDIGDIVIARFHVTNDPNSADADDEEQLLVINQPAGIHIGGHILFDSDGYLYIGIGDGGGEGDTFQNAQNPASLHGKILRIQVSQTGTYTIPSDNPFVGVEGYRPEIWAMGLRNPWRFGLDRATGDLYVADVGQEMVEEINHVPATEIGDGGMNFGWPILEGNLCFPPNGLQTCNSDPFVRPVATFSHVEGCSVIGGALYRVQKPFQSATYLYGDFCTGKLWGMQQEGAEWNSVLLHDFEFMISSFGEDSAGNLYLISYHNEEGDIYRISAPDQFSYLPSLLRSE
jgi:hypothetical protein